VSIPIVSGFRPKILVPSKPVLRENGGLNIIFYYFQKIPKRHILAPSRLLTYFAWRSVWGLGCWLKNQKKRNNSRTWGVIFHLTHTERRTPSLSIWIKFCARWDIRDIITDANFGPFWDDRLRRFSVASGQILDFSIGFRRRPYNTLTLSWGCD